MKKILLIIMMIGILFSSTVYAETDRWIWAASSDTDSCYVDKKTITEKNGNIYFWVKQATPAYNRYFMTQYCYNHGSKKINEGTSITYINGVKEYEGGKAADSFPRDVLAGSLDETLTNIVCDQLHISRPFTKAPVWEWVYSTNTQTFVMDIANNSWTNGLVVVTVKENSKSIKPYVSQYMCDFQKGEIGFYHEGTQCTTKAPVPESKEEAILEKAEKYFNGR